MNLPVPHMELVSSPRGEVRVETGVGFVRRAQRKQPNSPFVSLRLHVHRLSHPIDAIADDRAEPFATLFKDGVAAFSVEFDRVLVSYRVELHRHTGVDPSIALRDLDVSMKRRRLVRLVPYSAEAHSLILQGVYYDTPDGCPSQPALAFDGDLGDLTTPPPTPAPRAAPVDWKPFEALIDYTRQQLAGHIENYGYTAATTAQDQVQASARQWLTESGIDIGDEHQLRAVFTGIAFVNHCARGLGAPAGFSSVAAVRQALCALLLNMPAGSEATA